jgi:hypothetical protein
MPQWIGCDAHKKFSVFVAVDERGKAGHAVRVEHKREVFRTYLEGGVLVQRRHTDTGGNSHFTCRRFFFSSFAAVGLRDDRLYLAGDGRTPGDRWRGL